jgi:hypothetical protein
MNEANRNKYRMLMETSEQGDYEVNGVKYNLTEVGGEALSTEEKLAARTEARKIFGKRLEFHPEARIMEIEIDTTDRRADIEGEAQ